MPGDEKAAGTVLPTKAERGVELLLGFLVSLILFALMLMTAVDVLGRYFFNVPLLGAYELSEIAIALVVGGSLPLVTMRREHVEINVLDPLLVGKGHELRAALVGACGVFANGVVAWRIWVEAVNARELQAVSDLLQIPRAPILYFVSTSLALAAVIGVVIVIRHLRQLGQPRI
jgi:TRAP-type C4-dicarboxylate transport system permease small subunit